jgi:hypothetical protein
MYKIPKIKEGYQPSLEKQPKAVAVPDRARTVQWCFQLFDKSACWHEKSYAEETFRHVACLLREYSGRTWGQIEQDRKRDHAVEIAGLIPEARQRLQALHLDDCGPFWRFRFDGVKRIWGIRDRHVFRILWWDPQHRVCPSKK